MEFASFIAILYLIIEEKVFCLSNVYITGSHSTPEKLI